MPTVNLEAGQNLIVYAVGSLEDETFTFYVQDRTVGSAAPAGGAPAGDGTPAPTQVNTGDAIPASSSNVLLAGALGLLLVAGGAGIASTRRTNA